MSELKPCPFCGTDKHVERFKKHVRCEYCGARGPHTSEDYDDDTCEDDWNRRPALTDGGE